METFSRSLRNLALNNKNVVRYSTRPEPKDVLIRVRRGDIVGPPNPVSNIRPITFHIPADETTLEKEYRQTRQKVQAWHEDFWSKHNAAFVKERKEFERLNKKTNDSLGADEMSVFYKSFLDKYWHKHLAYNYEWYKKNFKLLKLAFKAELQRYYLRFSNK